MLDNIINKINQLMTGKKKISTAALLPLITASVQTAVGDPGQAETLVELVQQYLPTLVALVGGTGYAVIEGVNDNTRLKTAQNIATSDDAVSTAQTAVNTPTAAQTASVENTQVGVVAAAVVEEEPVTPWDMDAFDKQVKGKAPAKYTVLNAATELFMALDLGQVTHADYLAYVTAYWDYIQMKADARFDSIWGYSYAEALEHVSEPGCPSRPSTCGRFSSLKNKALNLGEQYYTAYLDFTRYQRKAADVADLSYQVSNGLNWRALLPENKQTLYWVGESAADLLKNV